MTRQDFTVDSRENGKFAITDSAGGLHMANEHETAFIRNEQRLLAEAYGLRTEVERLREALDKTMDGYIKYGQHGHPSVAEQLAFQAILYPPTPSEGKHQPPHDESCNTFWTGNVDGTERCTCEGKPKPESPRVSALAIVEEQAKDDGLWFRAQYATEAYLQTALRRLHDAVEKSPRVWTDEEINEAVDKADGDGDGEASTHISFAWMHRFLAALEGGGG